MAHTDSQKLLRKLASVAEFMFTVDKKVKGIFDVLYDVSSTEEEL